MDSEVKAILERFWEWRLESSPEFATMIGVHSYDDRLDSHALSYYDQRQDDCKEFLQQLGALKTNDLSKNDLLNVSLLKKDVQSFLDGSQHMSYLLPINNLEGPQLEFPRTISWMKFNTMEDYSKIFSRLEAFPKQISEFISLLKKGIETGYIPPKVTVAHVPEQIQSCILDASIEGDSKLYAPFKNIPESFTEAERKHIKEKSSLIDDKVKSAFKDLLEFLTKEYIPASRDTISCEEFPNGKEFYKKILEFHITCDLTPQQVHDIGLKEVARIRERMIHVVKETGFEGGLTEFVAMLRKDKRFYYEKKDDLMARYRDLCYNQIQPKLKDFFKTVPKAKFEIIETPAEAAPSAPGAFYLAPPEDGARPGSFFVNTYKHEERPNYETVSLSLHEAVPGHHLQCLRSNLVLFPKCAYCMEQAGQPRFRKYFEDRRYYEAPARFAMNTAYMEGWGLYSEFLGEEMCLYSDPYDLFGRLSHEIMRACRLVVDTGMHALGWTRQQAVDYMSQNTAMSKHDIDAEINRYITWAGQACAYKIGEIKIRELRQRAQDKLGDAFDLLEFHDLVLAIGAVPLETLEETVDDYIRSVAKA
ncbi:hypothetical protein QZH41_016331 [Actinostola sp. cb2023]|nr:hypothetical protein QZH41_016331 [Actinostola sp. cb2023]